MRRLAFALLAGCLCLGGCKSAATREAFEMSAREYNKMFRWGEMEGGCIAFAEPSQVETCRERAHHAAKASLVELRTKGMEYVDEEGKERGTVSMEVDYYILPSGRLKTIAFDEKWGVREIDGSRKWKLTELPPELK